MPPRVPAACGDASPASGRGSGVDLDAQPAGRAGASRPGRRQSAAWSGARTSQRPSAGPSTSTGRRRARPSTNAAAASPGHGGQRRLRAGSAARPGGPPRPRPAGTGRRGRRRRSPRGSGRRVWTRIRPPPLAAHRPGGRPGPAGPGPARRRGSGGPAAPGRSRGRPPRRAPATRCSTASVPTRIGRVRRRAGAVVGRDLGHRPAGQRLAAPPGPGSRPTRSVFSRVAPQARQTAGRTVARQRRHAQARRRRRRVDRRPAHTLAAGQLAARRAGQQAGPALAVEHADHPAAGLGLADAASTRRDEYRPEPGRLAPAVDDLDDRPARPAPRCGTGASSRPAAPAPPATGTATSARTARPPAGPARRPRRGRSRSGARSSW